MISYIIMKNGSNFVATTPIIFFREVVKDNLSFVYADDYELKYIRYENLDAKRLLGLCKLQTKELSGHVTNWFRITQKKIWVPLPKTKYKIFINNHILLRMIL